MVYKLSNIPLWKNKAGSQKQQTKANARGSNKGTQKGGKNSKTGGGWAGGGGSGRLKAQGKGENNSNTEHKSYSRAPPSQGTSCLASTDLVGAITSASVP